MADAYDDYLSALDDEVAREKEARDGSSWFTALLDASQRATQRQIRGSAASERPTCRRREPMPNHAIALESSFIDGGWTATCSCGWTGERQDTMREASADSASHLDFTRSAAPPRKDETNG